MEREKKRKRAEKAKAKKTDDPTKSKAIETMDEEAAAVEEPPPPTEEEVDEFFAILRRMRVAAKYFEKEGFNIIRGSNEPRISPAVLAADDGVVKRVAELDLNAAPAESS